MINIKKKIPYIFIFGCLLLIFFQNCQPKSTQSNGDGVGTTCFIYSNSACVQMAKDEQGQCESFSTGLGGALQDKGLCSASEKTSFCTFSKNGLNYTMYFSSNFAELASREPNEYCVAALGGIFSFIITPTPTASGTPIPTATPTVTPTPKPGMPLPSQKFVIDEPFMTNLGRPKPQSVLAVAFQSEGKILAATDGYIGRFNSNGTSDLSFKKVPYNFPDKIVVQGNDKILVVSEKVPGAVVKRFLADGDPDDAFNRNVEGALNAPARDVVVQTDGKIVVAGGLNELTRISSAGILDTSYNANTSLWLKQPVQALGLQKDGRIVALSEYSLIRVNSDGTKDESFNFERNTQYSFTTTLAIQPDQKILIAASGYDAVAKHFLQKLFRLNSNGSFDGSFDAQPIDSGFDFDTLALQSNGNIVVGAFRFNPDGSAKGSPGGYLAIQPDDKLLSFGGFGGTEREDGCQSFDRWNADGSLDMSFRASINAYPGGKVRDILIQDDGKILVASRYCPYLRRINKDGSYDSAFNINIIANEPVVGAASLAKQGDKILVVDRSETHYRVKNLIRYNSDGTQDEVFRSTLEKSLPEKAYVNQVFVTTNGKIWIVGENLPGSLQILSAEGTVSPGLNLNLRLIESIAESKNEFFITGWFEEKLLKLFSFASINSEFRKNISSKITDTAYKVAVQSDGKVIVSTIGIYGSPLKRFTPDGISDTTFDQNVKKALDSANFSWSNPNLFEVQPDDKILIIGSWRSLRLNADGTLDSYIDTLDFVNSRVERFVLQPDGKVLVGRESTSGETFTRVQIVPK